MMRPLSLVLASTLLCFGACASAGTPAGARGPSDPGVGSAGDAGPSPTTAAAEACDTYDNDADGAVDEGCTCTVGESQPCHPFAPGEDVRCPRTGEQRCSGESEFGAWGVCEVAALVDGELCAWWVIGEGEGDRLTLGETGGFGDFNGDGHLDVAATSLMAAPISGPDPGRAYVLFAGPSRMGTVTDLAVTRPDGVHALAVEGTSNWYALYTRPTRASVWLGDVNGDALSDLLVSTRGRAWFAVFGRPHPAAQNDVTMADGTVASLLTQAVGSHGISGVMSADVDGDGVDEVISAGNNSTTGGDVNEGLSIWTGRGVWDASTPRDRMIPIGIAGIGQSSLGNFSNLGGAGDFDGDGQVDVTVMHGAANDTMITPYRSYVYYGGPAGIEGSAMNAFSAGTATSITGGTGDRGAQPIHQAGDLNGDGMDDVVLGNVGAPHVYVVYGRADRPASVSLSFEMPAEVGFALRAPTGFDMSTSPSTVAMGDIDGDGLGDLVFLLTSATGAEARIRWGRAERVGGEEILEGPRVTVVPLAAVGTPVFLAAEALDAPTSTALADLDSDGRADLVVGFAGADTHNGPDSGAGVVLYATELALARP